MLWYGEIPIPDLSGRFPEAAQAISRLVSPTEAREFYRRHWRLSPGAEHCFNVPSGDYPYHPVKLDSLYWPTGASSWAVAHYLADEATLNEIRALAYAGGAYVPLPLRIDDADGGVVETDLYMLPARPLFQYEGNQNLYLLTLVDDRYFWWDKTVAVNSELSGWSALLSAINDIQPVTYPAPDAAYLVPSRALAGPAQRLPYLMDAVAYSLGWRVIRKLDGTVEMVTASASRSAYAANFLAYDADRVGGGEFALDPDDANNDLLAKIPGSVSVGFPTVNSAAIDYWMVTVDLVGLALAEYGSAEGNSGVKLFADDVQADFAGSGAEPDNAAELQALAEKAATDYYLWQIPGADLVVGGSVPWDGEAHSFMVEWEHSVPLGKVTTRVQAGPDSADRLLHGPGDYSVTPRGGSHRVDYGAYFYLTANSTTTYESASILVMDGPLWSITSNTVTDVTVGTVWNITGSGTLNIDVDIFTFTATTITIEGGSTWTWDDSTRVNMYGLIFMCGAFFKCSVTWNLTVNQVGANPLPVQPGQLIGKLKIVPDAPRIIHGINPLDGIPLVVPGPRKLQVVVDQFPVLIEHESSSEPTPEYRFKINDGQDMYLYPGDSADFDYDTDEERWLVTNLARNSGLLTLETGGTAADLSASGGTGYVVMQESAGGAFTSRALTNDDLPLSGVGAGTYTKVTVNTAGIVTAGSTADLGTSDVTGTLAAARFPALTGDVTNAAGDLATTVVGINGNPLGDTTLRFGGVLIDDGSEWVSASANGDVTWGPPTAGNFTTTIQANVVSNSKIRQSAARSVIGRSAASTGNVADITSASGTGAVLRESGGTIGFGAINLSASVGVTGTLTEGNGGTNQTTYTTGNILYASATNTLAKLAPNTTTTRKFLKEVSSIPSWDTLVAGDIPDLDASKITTGELSIANGGTGIDASAVADGNLLIGDSGGFTLAGLSPGAGISINTAPGVISIATDIAIQLAVTGASDFITVTGSPADYTGGFSIDWTGDYGDLLYCSATDTWSRLAANSTGTMKFLSSISSGLPAWESLSAAYIVAGTLAVTRGGTGLNGAAASNGQLLIGNGSGYTLATLTQGAGITITNSAGGITIASNGGVGPVAPTGTIDGANTTFTLPSTPSSPSSLLLFKNGVLQTQDAAVDYTLSGATITYNTPPASGDKLFAVYNVATGTGGTVTSVARSISGASFITVGGSPITGSGTLTDTWTGALGDVLYASATDTWGKLAGNTTTTAKYLRQVGNGTVSAAPAWSTLAAGDITSGQLALARGGTGVDASGVTNGQLLIGKTSDNTLNLATLTAGTGISITNGGGSIEIAATSSGGTVTSVARSISGASFITVSGSPVTGSGTLTDTWTGTKGDILYASDTNTWSKLAGNTTTTLKFLAQVGTVGASAAPEWTIGLVEVTAGTGLTGGGIAIVGGVSVTLDLDVPVSLENGGTGLDASGVTNGQILIGKTSDHTLNLATLTAGSGISVTNGAASITIAASLSASDIPNPAGDVGGTFAATVIANDAVTYAKMQNVSAASRLLGRGSAAGSGDVQEISLGSGLSMSGTTLSATSTGGTVTSVGLSLPSILTVSGSPVTSSGTLTATLATQSANTFFAGPTSGAATTPAFRAFALADLPSQNASTLLGRGNSGFGVPQAITLGSGLVMTGTTLSATAAGSGTVTSVGVSFSGASFISTSGSPVTSSGSILHTWTGSTGQILYCSSTNTWSRLAANTGSTPKFLKSQGSGGSGTAPSWDTITGSDISGGEGWVKITLDRTDFSVASTTRTLNLYTPGTGYFLKAILWKPTTAWTGGGNTSATLEFGRTGSDGAYGPNGTVNSGGGTNMKNAVSATNFGQSNECVTDLVLPDYRYAFDGSLSVRVTLDCSVNINTLTAGEVDIYLLIGSLPG